MGRLFAPTFLRNVIAEGIDLAEACGAPCNFIRTPEYPQTCQINALRTIADQTNVPYVVDRIVTERSIGQVEWVGIGGVQGFERPIAGINGDHAVAGCEGFHGVSGLGW